MSDGNRQSLPYVDPADADQPFLYPGANGRCVDCGGTLIAKCGEINRWHWSHEAMFSDCTGTDGESSWHLAWKAWCERHGSRTEVDRGQHRADAIWPDGSIYEFQSSYLNTVDITRREEFWGEGLTWVYRITPGRFNRLTNVGDGWFRWRRPAVSMTRHERPVIWHVGERVFDTTVALIDGEVRVKFTPGERDEYGPVLYGSRPAPFHVGDSVRALRRLAIPKHVSDIA